MIMRGHCLRTCLPSYAAAHALSRDSDDVLDEPDEDVAEGLSGTIETSTCPAGMSASIAIAVVAGQHCLHTVSNVSRAGISFEAVQLW